MSDTAEAALWSHAGLELGEGPRWVDGRPGPAARPGR
jgi:hypothetical protein